jgi:hypothetical protein
VSNSIVIFVVFVIYNEIVEAILCNFLLVVVVVLLLFFGLDNFEDFALLPRFTWL